ncbi:MAG: glycoside hydrolase [Sphingobacteriales bacterium]|nr:MAG: glycoside hydrolase [Sphingobacteriales bacterium]
MKLKFVLVCLLLFWGQALFSQTDRLISANKPWTRWWWMGSAVDETGIKKQLTQMAGAGFGGVEIVPIYGAKGYEATYVKYLSPQWMRLLDYTVAQAQALNMGVYISVGTGWPIGGTHVTKEDAASKLIVQKYTLKANEKLADKIEVNDIKQKEIAILSALVGYKENGEIIDLSDKLQADGLLNYTANADMEIIAAFTGKTKQAVKRAAPGGEGFTIDHFSATATANYFKIFDTAFGNTSHGVKAFFNDSYEVYNADWTPQFFNEFKTRRGYDLRNYLPQLTGTLLNDTVARIKSDYRETIADLMLQNFSSVFTAWTNKRNTKSVNQAHGSPGNLLDLYGAFDIPECETFGSSYFAVKGLRRDSADIRNVDPDPIMLKFASSAAHEYNKPLTSSETFTWLGEHFKTAWSQCKPELDQVFLSGVNHVFYHGTTYTPADVKFPGWLFYASVNFVPHNSIWKHLKGLNEYIARCQAVLQAGNSDYNTVKIYWPVYDVWHNANGLDMPLGVHSIEKWLHPTAFYKNVTQLQNNGYEVDFLSDEMLAKRAANAPFYKKSRQIIIVPECQRMPVSTLRNIVTLGVNTEYVIFQSLPQDVPGFNSLSKERAALRHLIDSLNFKQVAEGINETSLKTGGKIILSNDIAKALEYIKWTSNEKMAALGLKFIKRRQGDSLYYFIANNTAKDIDETIQLNTNSNSIVFINPLNGETGRVPFQKEGNAVKLRMQLKSGQSIIVRSNYHVVAKEAKWKYTEPVGHAINLEKNIWKLHFAEGGPSLPKNKTVTTLQPWTNFTEDTATQFFSGTGVYTTSFTLKNKATDYLLQLDQLYESARIMVNGKEAGLIWSLPFELKIGKFLKKGTNTISIEVCNLMANRIRQMDRNGEVWRNYHEINFVNINYKPFDASNWKVLPSGLGGTVKLIPLQ